MRAMWALVALAVAGCSSGPDPRFLPDATKTQSAAEVEANTGVRLPVGALFLSGARVELAGGLDTRTVARFRIDADGLPEFLSANGFPDLTPDRRAVTDGDLPDSGTWRPDQATRVAGVVDGSRKVMVELDHPGEVTVYLVTSQS
ncbi:hypothetical protein [Actinosynnema sp. NPDC020468]|uniref:hypothetical protein n=1 Tax=Actinosynnema sp. NPDC020468 TaxID=3154488 RepID=UPI0033E3D74D